MSSANDERRFSEEEFALVLRMASEDAHAVEPAPGKEGLTLSQIREIAVEVGIDPEKITRAVALLPREGPESGLAKLMGGRPIESLEQIIPGEASEKDLARIAEVVRREVGVQGKTREVLGALEWSGNTTTTIVSVSATPGEGTTALQASTDRTGALLGIIAGAGLPTLGVVAFVLVKLVFGETDAGIIMGLLSALPPSLLVSRHMWKQSTRAWRERRVHVLEAMRKEMERLRGGGATGPDDGGMSLPPGGSE